MSSREEPSDRILIVGFDRRPVRSIERLLEAAGYATAVTSSFKEAHDLMRADKISLAILELVNGEPSKRQWKNRAFDFCRSIRQDQMASGLPILVISNSTHDKAAALNAGAADCIIKPYRKAELLSRIKVHLNARRFEREITDRFEDLNTLREVSSILASSLEPEVLLRGALAALVRTTQADAGIVYFDTSGQAVNVVASIGFEHVTHSHLIDLYSTLTPLFKGKPALEPIEIDHLPTIVNGMSSALCAPLGLKSKTVGAICLFSRKPSSHSKRLSELLSTICNQLSIALENARLYIETKKSEAQLSFLYNLGTNLMTSLEMDELLGYTVFAVGRHLGCDVCAVVVRNSAQEGGLASAVYTRSGGCKLSPSSQWYRTDQVARYLEKPEASVGVIFETRAGERLLSDPEISVETTIPLVFDDTTLGVLICANYAARRIGEDDARLLAAVSQQLSLAIRNTELFQKTKSTSIYLAAEVARRTRQIEEQKRFTEKIIDSLPVSLYVIDRQMRIVAWNRNRELGGQGISRDAVLGRSVFQVLTRQPRHKLENEFMEVFRTGQIIRLEQQSWANGQKKFWRISKIPMRVDDAEVTHVITVGEDITEQKKMNDAIIHAEKLASIGRLAAGVVHELNNPLATIAACAEALTARLAESSSPELGQDFGEYLQIIRDESFRCKTITNNLLDFSHQRQAEKLPSDINQIIEQTLLLIKHHPKLGKMNIVKEFDPTLAPVYVNEGQMKQIFIAFISNAFDAMDGGGQLTIRTRWYNSAIEPAICIEFIDTGCGIPASHLPKIFDPFFTTKPLGRGTGLGLSVCYGIVSEHGGRIEVDSIEGVGSTFRTILPVRLGHEFTNQLAPKWENAL
jgi:two-component system NtrC family sensor kinase